MALSVEVSAGVVKLGSHAQYLALFTSIISIIMTWCPIKNFCIGHWVGPRKSASNRAPHLLTPALVVALVTDGNVPSRTTLTWNEDLLPCYCYAVKTKSRTIRQQVSQPTSALQAKMDGTW